MSDIRKDKISVFLSYARADDNPDYDTPEKSFMRRLYNALTDDGFDVWWDREKLPARSLSFTKEIEDAIRDCPRFVLIAGPGAKASDYVTAEWMFALGQCKPITPVLRAGEYNVIPLEIAGINAIDCRPTRAESAAFRDLINRLREDAPIGDKIGVKELPHGYVNRLAPFNAARDALLADAIQTTVTVISTPQRASQPGRDDEPQQAVSVYGLGGIGKSTLAAALADDCDVRRHFPDGVIWLEVGQMPIITSLQASIGVLFGDNRDNYQNEDDGTRSLSLVLRNKSVLLVLDDVWDHKIVGRFPVSGTACRLLITTRSGSLAGRVEGADIRLDLLSPDEGAQVIAGRTGKSVDDPLYRKISQTLGGHTLAVRLAAHQIAEKYADDAADLLRLLEKRAAGTEPFVDLAVDDEDKDLNLALSLSLSYDALKDDDLRRRFRATGIFALEGSFDRAALAAVWGDADEDDARKPIQIFIGAGLLDEAEGEGRYSQHRLLRAYGRALLAEAGELDAVFERYADFYTAHAYAVFVDLPPEQWSQHDTDLPDITALGDALMERTENGTSGDLTRAMAFIYSLVIYIRNRRETHKWPWLEMGLNAVRALRTESPEDKTLIRHEALFLNELGLALDNLGEKRKAIAYYEQKLPLSKATGDLSSEATTLNNIGMAYRQLGDVRKALDYCEEALPLYRAVGDRGGEATALINIGAVWNMLGDKHKALEFFKQALPLCHAVGDRGREAATLNNIGKVWDDLGEKRKALDFYEQALPLRRAVGDRDGEATTLNNMAAIYYQGRNLEKAVDLFQQVNAIFREIGAVASEATTLNNIGMVWDALGETSKALEFYEQALPVFRAVGDRNGEATTLNNIGGIYFSMGELERAVEAQYGVIDIARAVGNVAGEALYLLNIAYAYQRMGRIDEAIQSAETGRDILIRYNLPQNAGGNKVAEYDALLAELRGENPPQEDPQAAFVRQIVALYQQGGAESVRSMLAEMGATEEQIVDLLAQLETALGGDAG